MNASMSRRQWLGLAAAASAGAAIQRHRALGADAPSAPARPRLAVCIDALFTDVPFEERPAKVKAAGVDAFEFWGWRGREMKWRRLRVRDGSWPGSVLCLSSAFGMQTTNHLYRFEQTPP